MLWHINLGINLPYIRKIQKRAVRFISNSKYNAHTQPLFKKFNILSVDDIFTHKLYCFYYKLKNIQLPQYFISSFQLLLQQDLHDHATRSINFVIPKTSHSFADNCIRIQLPILLNKHTVEIINKVSTHCYQGFSHYVKICLISNYSSICIIPNCYVCR